MNTPTHAASHSTDTQKKTSTHAADLLTIFNQYADHIKILSLDCFDTLLWRKTAEPSDVFYNLCQRPAFKELKMTTAMRISGELYAYQMNRVKKGTTQAKLDDIYKAIFPNFNNEQIQVLIEEELKAEMEICFAFPPIIELIREAYNRGIKIIIVSDTYLEEKQLHRLLENSLPHDVMSAILKIFCSSEKEFSKGEGLFNFVLHEYEVSPKSILHIGDNPFADHDAPSYLGINAIHLIHHDENLTELMRMHPIYASFMDPEIRTSRALFSPYRSLFASQLGQTTPENLIGYVSLGPILYAFAKFVYDEVEKLRQAGKKPKILFLMRDAYLPSLACEAFAEKPLGNQIRISRFATFAASFRCKTDIDHYLAKSVQSLRFKDMCNQLLLPELTTTQILEQISRSNNKPADFIKMINQENVQQIIFKQSASYRERLKKHLEKTIGLKRGDTLVFVDLGYMGTAQIKLAPVFKEEMDVDIAGIYLIALHTHECNSYRKGLFDHSAYNEKTLIMLVTYIALFEKLCNSNEKSVVDYDNNGDAIYSEIDISNVQQNKLEPIQAACLRFIRDAKNFINQSKFTVNNEILRDAAAISLGRLIFLPTRPETEYLQTFQFDVGLGTKEILPLFDLNKGLTSLRRRGWLYSTKENIKNMRINYPAEWRAASLELSLAFMAQQRFGFKFALNDLSQRRENIEIIIMQDKQTSVFTLDATPTHDGYFSLLIPIPQDHQIGLHLGLNYQWIEIESAQQIRLDYLFSHKEFEHSVDASPFLKGHQMQNRGGGLFECHSNAGLLIYHSPQNLDDEKYVLRLTFRPIVRRSEVAQI